MTKTSKTQTSLPVLKAKKTSDMRKESARDVIIRVWRVITASSIAYAIVVIVMGTEGILPKVMLFPAALYAAFLLIKR